MLRTVGWVGLCVCLPQAVEAYALRIVQAEAAAGILELEGVAGTSTGPITVGVELEILPGELGVHSWSFGLAHDIGAMTLLSATVAGTAGDAPALSTVETIPGGGLIATGALDLDHSVLLAPGTRSLLLFATYQGTFPARDTTLQTRIRLVDGLEGSQGPVSTLVTSWDGAAESRQAPGRENLILLVSAFEYSPFFELSLVTEGGRPGAEGDVVQGFVRPGTQPTYLVRVLLESRLPSASTSGAQGWSLAIAHERGALEVDSVTTGGTEAGALIRNGFERHELVDNETGPGLVSAVVLSFSLPISFPPQGRAHLLATSYRLLSDTSVDGVRIQTSILFRDKMKGQGQPVNNVVTYLGESNRPLVRRGLALDLEVGEPPLQPFRRSDANDDGRTNIADAAWLVLELFRGGQPTACFYAADLNADGAKDISDVAFLIEFQFLGGRAPPPPFPGCGALPEQDPRRCPLGSTACSQ